MREHLVLNVVNEKSLSELHHSLKSGIKTGIKKGMHENPRLLYYVDILSNGFLMSKNGMCCLIMVSAALERNPWMSPDHVRKISKSTPESGDIDQDIHIRDST